MSRPRLLAPVIAAALATACQPDPLTEIMVVVETDMTVPSELDGFRVEVRDGNESLVHSQSFDLAQQVTLPATSTAAPVQNHQVESTPELCSSSWTFRRSVVPGASSSRRSKRW